MAKKSKAKRKRKGVTIPLMLLAGLQAPARVAWAGYKQGGPDRAMQQFGMVMTGYDSRDGQFKSAELKYGLYPVLVGAGLHKLMNKLGVNRALAASGIPFIRL